MAALGQQLQVLQSPSAGRQGGILQEMRQQLSLVLGERAAHAGCRPLFQGPAFLAGPGGMALPRADPVLAPRWPQPRQSLAPVLGTEGFLHSVFKGQVLKMQKAPLK